MQRRLSVVYITYNAKDTLRSSLESIKDIADEIVVVDGFSTDTTVDIADHFGARIYKRHYRHEGRQKSFVLSKAANDWVLVVESDEVASKGLINEIKKVLSQKNIISGYMIPFKNYYLNRHVRYGGQSYNKLRLFDRRLVIVENKSIHAEYKLKGGKAQVLKNVIHHYSYRSVGQIFTKFTKYAIREAEFKKMKGEKTGVRQILLHPPHMFWARFVEDKGYKDGVFRIPLDLAFAYMEFLTYLSMLFIKNK